VIGDVVIQGKTYASVHYNKIIQGSRPFYIPYDTLYYRVEGQKLFRWVDGADRLLYDFSITKGGSIDDIQHESPGYYAPLMNDITLKADPSRLSTTTYPQKPHSSMWIIGCFRSSICHLTNFQLKKTDPHPRFCTLRDSVWCSPPSAKRVH
jgi:hypothetical protein